MNARGARNAQLIEGSPQAEVPQEADVSNQAEEEEAEEGPGPACMPQYNRSCDAIMKYRK